MSYSARIFFVAVHVVMVIAVIVVESYTDEDDTRRDGRPRARGHAREDDEQMMRCCLSLAFECL